MTQDICTNCVMDLSAKEITFDENGVCNFCHQAQKSIEDVKAENKTAEEWANEIVGGKCHCFYDNHGSRVAAHMHYCPWDYDNRKKYDVLIGLSGGVDSSYLLMKAVELGLRPFCFSVDNGWNDPRADENIMKLVEGMKVPFYRYVIDLDKFKELQSAFIQAGLKNIEIPTDHILMATSLELAAKYDIKWILSGGNVATESIMPPSWGYNARDLTHIKDVFKKVRGKKLNGLPLCSVWKWNWYKWVKGIKTLYLLDYLEYNREKAIKELSEKYGYESYGDKHNENYFTRWFQSFYLFEKFGIDKRKPHYSSLINSGQMTRSEALTLLQENPIYPELGLEERALRYRRHEHEEFKMDKWYGRISYIVRLIKRFL